MNQPSKRPAEVIRETLRRLESYSWIPTSLREEAAAAVAALTQIDNAAVLVREAIIAGEPERALELLAPLLPRVIALEKP